MMPEDIMRSLAVRNECRIVLFVLDGVGGLPMDGRTELEAAHTPNLDRLAARSVCGQTVPVARGITPGVGPATLALFGYDPLKYTVSQGILEALGMDVEVGPDDVAARGNFASRNDRGIITDRRAGRLDSAKCRELCERLSAEIPEIRGARVLIHAGQEHRFNVLFRREGLDGRVSDADPRRPNHPAVAARAKAESARETAEIANEFIRRATDLLRDDPSANTVLLRGFGRRPDIPTLTDLYQLNPAGLVHFPLYRGLARLLGLALLEGGETFEQEMECLRAHFSRFDFFYLHYRPTDAPAEEADFDRKVAAIEAVDRYIPALLSVEPDVIAVAGDRANPTLLRGHSWHPNPFLLWSPYVTPDEVKHFTEVECSRGGLGRFPAVDIMSFLLAHALKLAPYDG